MGQIVRTISVKWFVALPFYFFTFLPLTAGNTLPKETAAHFCRLLVNDGEGRVSTLSSYIRSQQTATSDSLTLEQLFCNYVFQYDGWQTLRIFPHSNNGIVSWYAAIDKLPADLDPEHQKYIHDVFPHLAAEIEAGNWATVDAYITRMEQYQCRFGGSQQPTPNIQHLTPMIAASLILLFLLIPVLMTKRPFVSLSYITKGKPYEKDYRDRSSRMPRGQGDSR